MVSRGEISKDTLVWKAGMAGWETAGGINELNELWAQVPPPLPK